MHMTWLVNSVVHVWGSREYESGDNSRNNPLVALLVFGDGERCHESESVHMSVAFSEWWTIGKLPETYLK